MSLIFLVAVGFISRQNANLPGLESVFNFQSVRKFENIILLLIIEICLPTATQLNVGFECGAYQYATLRLLRFNRSRSVLTILHSKCANFATVISNNFGKPHNFEIFFSKTPLVIKKSSRIIQILNFAQNAAVFFYFKNIKFYITEPSYWISYFTFRKTHLRF